MRGKISDQDLTNYALNDGLEPRERLYIESMLAVSEECRSDIYRAIDFAQLLEEGFEEEQELTTASLTDGQRQALLNGRAPFSPMAFVHKTAAALALAACAALVLANPQFWSGHRSVRGLTAASAEVSRLASTDTFVDEEPDFSPLEMPASSYATDDSDTLIQTSSDMSMPMPMPETICTPPTWEGNAEAVSTPELH